MKAASGGILLCHPMKHPCSLSKATHKSLGQTLRKTSSLSAFCLVNLWPGNSRAASPGQKHNLEAFGFTISLPSDITAWTTRAGDKPGCRRTTLTGMKSRARWGRLIFLHSVGVRCYQWTKPSRACNEGRLKSGRQE